MPTATQLSDQLRADQVALARETVGELAEISGALNFRAVDASAAGWLVAAEAITVRQHAKSVELGAALYGEYRAASGITGEYAPELSSLDRRGLRAALVVLGPYAAKKAMSAGIPIEQAALDVFANTSGRSVKFALSGARDTVQATAATDQRCTGYMRVTSAKPCAFCALLSQNVYRSLSSASTVQGGRNRAKNPQPRDSRYHSHCMCRVVPIFNATSWPTGAEDQAQGYLSLWDEVSAAGGSLKEREARFIEAFNARTTS